MCVGLNRHRPACCCCCFLLAMALQPVAEVSELFTDLQPGSGGAAQLAPTCVLDARFCRTRPRPCASRCVGAWSLRAGLGHGPAAQSATWRRRGAECASPHPAALGPAHHRVMALGGHGSSTTQRPDQRVIAGPLPAARCPSSPPPPWPGWPVVFARCSGRRPVPSWHLFAVGRLQIDPPADLYERWALEVAAPVRLAALTLPCSRPYLLWCCCFRLAQAGAWVPMFFP